MSADMEIVDKRTGELVAIRHAPTEVLAAATDELAELRARQAEVEHAISNELLGRLDRDAKWTQRVGDPDTGVQWEITAPSPTAGVEAYDPELLDGVLGHLIARGTVSAEAASGALARTVTLEVEVPWPALPEQIVDVLRTPDGLGATVTIADVEVRVTRCSAVRRPNTPGVRRLCKNPAPAEALLGTRADREPPTRRVKVTRKTQGRGA